MTIALAASVSLLSGAGHRPRLHRNPDIAILGIVEDREGMLWLAAEDGVYRFDGFRFVQHDADRIPSATGVATTRDGSVWVGSSRGLFRRRSKTFERVYEHRIVAMAHSTDRVFAAVDGAAKNGLYTFPIEGPPSGPGNLGRGSSVVDPEGGYWIVCGRGRADPGNRACRQGPEGIEYRDLIPTWGKNVTADRRNRIVVADSVRAEVLSDGKAVARFQRRSVQATLRPPAISVGPSGQVWFAGETVYGVEPPIELKERSNLDERSYPTVAFEDSRGRLWVAWRGRGLIEWTLDLEWRRWYLEDLAGAEPAQVGRDTAGNPIVAAGNLLLELTGEQWRPRANLGNPVAAFHPKPQGGFIVSVRNGGVVDVASDGRVQGRLQQEGVTIANPQWASDHYREPIIDRLGQWWVGSKVSLMRLESDAAGGTLHLSPVPGSDLEKPPALRDDQVVDLEIGPGGELWVGDKRGLLAQRDGAWHRLQTDSPVDPVRSFAPGRDDSWIAHRNGGPHYTRLVRDGETWRVQLFRAADGFGPEDTHFIKRDSRGWIWRGSTDGVHVSDGRHFAPSDWLHLDVQRGLAGEITEQYGFYEDDQGDVWISSFEGVTAVRPNASWFGALDDARPPVVTAITLDGRDVRDDEFLSADGRALAVTVGSLDAPPFRDSAFRYRFSPLEEEWRLSADGRIALTDPEAGDYVLEVGFSSDGPEDGPRMRYAFRVGDPSETSAWLLTLGAACGFGALLVLLVPPWRERAGYTMGKSWFLLKRRLALRESASPGEPSRPVELAPGEVLRNRFRIERTLSSGGFSVVYEASDLREGGRHVAIKVLSPRPGADRWVRDRFVHEVASLRTVSHPGVIRVQESWITPDGAPCIVMPLIEGPTLRKALAESSPDSRRAAELIRRIGSSVAAVHEHGIVHRDLKPENVLLVEDGDDEQPVLIDFGLAAMRAAEGELAGTTMLAGSLHYMAPERLSGRFSTASDVYSLAVLALEIIAGARTADIETPADEEGFEEALAQVICRRADPETAKHVASLIASGLSLSPRERPTDVLAWTSALADELERGTAE